MAKKVLYTCPNCSQQFYRYAAQATNGNPCCSLSCRGMQQSAKSPRASGTYTHVVKPGHPISGKNGRMRRSRYVLYEKIGPGAHPCHWCSSPVKWVIGKIGGGSGAIVADHVDRNTRNDSPENLVPSCQRCNAHRNDPDIINDGELFITVPDRHGNPSRARATQRTCEQCGVSFLVRTTDLVNRPALFCSPRCSMRHRHGRSGGISGHHNPPALPKQD